MTLILSNEDVERVLTMQDSLKAMEITFTDYAAAKAVNRPRSHTTRRLMKTANSIVLNLWTGPWLV